MKISRFALIAGMMGALLAASHVVTATPAEDKGKQAPVENVSVDEDETAIATSDAFEPGKWVDKAVVMLDEQMAKSPDKRIPQALLNNAKCVVLFPEVVQAGFVVGGKYGRGMVSCRDADSGDWGVPVFLRLTSINWGIQMGAQSADVIMLVMSDKGLDSLFSGKPLVGAGGGIAVGSVGRDTTANIDVLMQTPIVTYTRSKGVYVGAILEGVAITPAKAVNRSLYGEGYPDARSLLSMDFEVPENVAKLQSALAVYAAPVSGNSDEEPGEVPKSVGEPASE